MPRVSIGLPVYNGEKYLAAAIESLLNQTFEDLEVIISSNASTDATDDICRRYARRDGRIVFHRLEQNVGAAENFNRVFRAARGAYFKWAAHDDVCLPTFLQRCVETLDAAPPDVVLCMPRTMLIDDDGDEVGAHDDLLDLRQRRAARRMVEVARKILTCGCHSVFGVVRTDVLRRTRLIGPYVASDAVLLGELAAEGQLWEIPDRLFQARVHGDCSHRKFKTLEEYAAWFAPSLNRGYTRFIRTKIALELLRGIARSSSLPAWEKPICAAAFTAAWTGRQARVDAGAAKRWLLGQVRRPLPVEADGPPSDAVAGASVQACQTAKPTRCL